jgi:GNAT superfamily N-acetyltransferase
MTSSDPIIRPMRPDDAGTVVEMACELASAVGDPRPGLTKSELIRHSAGAASWFDCLVAEAAKCLVGYAVVCKAFEAHTGKKRLWIGDFYVRPIARRKGVGRALMTAIARYALELGCDAVYWELWRMNDAGRSFYRKLAAEDVADLALMRLGKPRLRLIAGG